MVNYQFYKKYFVEITFHCNDILFYGFNKINLWYRQLDIVLIFLGIVCVRKSVRDVRGYGNPNRIKIFNNSSTALK